MDKYQKRYVCKNKTQSFARLELKICENVKLIRSNIFPILSSHSGKTLYFIFSQVAFLVFIQILNFQMNPDLSVEGMLLFGYVCLF